MENELIINNGNNIKDSVYSMLSLFRYSEYIDNIKESNLYYKNKNLEISKKRRTYINPKTDKIENNTNLENTRINNPFLRKLVDQKVKFAISKDLLIDFANDDETLKKEYIDLWNQFYNEETKLIIQMITTNTIKNGIGWGYMYIDNGKLKITKVDSDEVYPNWNNVQHTDLSFIVRDYKETLLKNGTNYIINNVEYFDKDEVHYYTENNGSLTENNTKDNSYIKLEDSNVSWNKVPFVYLKSTDDETSILNLVKNQIDAYDKILSKSIDTKLDDIDPLLVVKNMDSEFKYLTETRQNVQNSRIMVLDGDGDAKYLKVDSDIDSNLKQLEFLRKDIMYFGDGVDTQDVKFGNNPSGVALKSSYEPLNNYTDGLELHFKFFMSNIKYFFDKYLEIMGKGSFEQFQSIKMNISFNRDMMINEDSLIDNTNKLKDIVSRKTLDKYNPAVDNHEQEEENRDNEYLHDIERDLKYNDINFEGGNANE